MKRPSRPVKRKAASKKIIKRKKPSKAFRKIKAGLDEALAHARAEPEWTAEDAAVFDIPKPPAGFAYQWAPFSRIIYMLSKGWEQVPFSRHPDLGRALNFDGYIVYRDTALFQISSALVDKELSRLKLMAKDMTAEFDASVGRHGEGFGFYILPQSFMVDSDYERVPEASPPIEMTMFIVLRVPSRWCDTANALNLPHAEYARRRIAQSGYLISPDDKGIFSPFELITTKVEF